MLRDSRQHARPDFLIIVKAEDEVWPADPGQRAVGAGGTLDFPPNAEECREDSARLGRALTAHAAWNVTVRSSGTASPCSKRSARTRKARA